MIWGRRISSWQNSTPSIILEHTARTPRCVSTTAQPYSTFVHGHVSPHAVSFQQRSIKVAIESDVARLVAHYASSDLSPCLVNLSTASRFRGSDGID
jgi:hypothetical protein